MKAIKYSEVKTSKEVTLRTGQELLDSFISTDGGFVCPSTILLTGTSGAGKTTLAYFLQMVFDSVPTYFYSRESTSSTVKNQMKRYNINHENAFISDRRNVETFDEFIADLHEVKPKVAIIDSIQMLIDQDLSDLSPEKAALYIIEKTRQWAEDTGGVVIVVCQLTKDGDFAGSSKIEFLFDAHLKMVYDRKKEERIMFWKKNRFGETAELFYKFVTEGIKFFTPEQWVAAKEKLELSDFINKSIMSYISLIKTSSPNYKVFKKEYNKDVNKLFAEGHRGIELTVKGIQLIQKYIVKYDLKAY